MRTSSWIGIGVEKGEQAFDDLEDIQSTPCMSQIDNFPL
jgi:hypothetical protein